MRIWCWVRQDVGGGWDSVLQFVVLLCLRETILMEAERVGVLVGCLLRHLGGSRHWGERHAVIRNRIK